MPSKAGVYSIYRLVELRQLSERYWSIEDLRRLFSALHARPEGMRAKIHEPVRREDVLRSIEHPNFHWVVAVVPDGDGTKLAAMGSLSCLPDPELGGVGHIDNVVTLPDYQGKGIGKRIVLELIRIAASYGRPKNGLNKCNFRVSRVKLTSSPWRENANEMYAKLGFEIEYPDTNFYRMDLK